jgi:hypothetical protein
MYDFLLLDGNLLFSYALLVIVALATVEIIGLFIGASVIGFGDSDFDFDVDMDTNGMDFFSVDGWLSWLGFGRIPVLAVLALIAFFFGLVGLTINQVVFSWVGQILPLLISAPVAIALSLPLVSASSRVIAKYLPRDETNSITVDKLTGQVGIITNGTATNEQVAFARVYDAHGVQHNVRVKGFNEVPIPERSQVRLDSYSDQGYFLVSKI